MVFASENSLSTINVERQPSKDLLQSLKVFEWPIWTKEPSEFLWYYDEQEVCYFLEGNVVVTPEGGEPVRVGKGDLVTFPASMSCVWRVVQPVKKHYQFG